MVKLLLLLGSGLLSISAMAQSQFIGPYGQISVGYEKNTASSAQLIGTDNGESPNASNTLTTSSASTQLVLGLGYTFAVKNNVTLGFGVDYSTLTQDTPSAGFYYPGYSSVYNYKFSVSNRVNLFVAPGYSIDENKLAYLKLGYSSQQVQYSQTNCCSTPSNQAQVSGYLLGVGYKQMVTGNLYGFAEANYYGYARPNMISTYSDGPGGTVTSSPNLSAYNFLLGMGYRF
jgi:hypothetical protein